MTMFPSKPIGRVPGNIFYKVKKNLTFVQTLQVEKIKKRYIDINLSLKVRLKLDLISITLMSLISAA